MLSIFCARYPLSIFRASRVRSSFVLRWCAGSAFPGVRGLVSWVCGFGCFRVFCSVDVFGCSGVLGSLWSLGVPIFRVLRFGVRFRRSGIRIFRGSICWGCFFWGLQIFFVRGRAVFDSFGNRLGLLFSGRVASCKFALVVICGIFRGLFGAWSGCWFSGFCFMISQWKKVA